LLSAVRKNITTEPSMAIKYDVAREAKAFTSLGVDFVEIL
jgi:hypothetical protein